MADNPTPVLGIIGGSGLYDIARLERGEWVSVDTPFGKPSDQLLCGYVGEQKVVFLPRHGRGHYTPPSELNFRANIDALKRLGVTEILSVSAVGSLREHLPPGTFVIVDQFIDRTVSRISSFFEKGMVGHVSMAHPVCARLGNLVEEAAHTAGVPVVRGGTYLVMEGPQFSTLAESKLYRQWGCDVIGMTNMPEAKLAREAEMCYATVAMITDYDCWHPEHDSVTVEQVVKVLKNNTDKAKALVSQIIPAINQRQGLCECGCQTALDFALITNPDQRDPRILAKLDAVAGRVLGPKRT